MHFVLSRDYKNIDIHFVHSYYIFCIAVKLHQSYQLLNEIYHRIKYIGYSWYENRETV